MKIEKEEDEIALFEEFKLHVQIQSYLEKNGYEIHSVEFKGVPIETKVLNSK